jgi:hypothetical protein
MTKPRGIEWLEDQTGESLDRQAPVSEGRHLSLRIPTDLADRLEAYAAARHESVSSAARRLLLDGLVRGVDADRDAIDAAISVLESVRGGLDRRTG